MDEKTQRQEDQQPTTSQSVSQPLSSTSSSQREKTPSATSIPTSPTNQPPTPETKQPSPSQYSSQTPSTTETSQENLPSLSPSATDQPSSAKPQPESDEAASEVSKTDQPPPVGETKGIPFLFWFLIGLAILIIAGGIAFYLLAGTDALPIKFKPTPIPQPTVEPSPLPPTITSSVVTTTPSATGSSSLRVVEGVGVVGIEIVKPLPNTIISSPVTIKGNANEFEGHVSLRIKDADGTILAEGFATGCMGEEPCPFETQLAFNQPKGKVGTVEAFSPSAKDGSEQDLVTIPVKFSPQQ